MRKQAIKAVVIIVCFFFPLSSFAQDLSALKIGVILPLSGDAAFWGSNPKKGIELALSQLQSSGGNFKAPTIIFEDDSCDPKRAVTAFKKLSQIDKVNLILGPACSSASLAVAPLAEKDKIPLFVFSEADALSERGEYIFRLWIPNGKQAKLLAKYIYQEKKLTSVAIIYIKNAYGEDFKKGFKEEFSTLGGTVIAEEEYTAEDANPKSQLLKIKSKKPQALILASYIADGGNILKIAKSIKLTDNYFASSTVNSPDFFKSTGDLTEGLVIFDINDSTDENFKKEWVNKNQEKWPGMQSGASIFYDFFNFIRLAVAEVGIKSENIKSYFTSGKSYQGKSMKLQFDSKGDLTAEHTGFVVKNGSLEKIK